ncbi:Rv3654c family TadE-like protein [Sphaerisporangium aureirubrum]|uniref:Rv3654c family TadE-like protein n=2 Tax=Sphaerisporangium aureirubrum TaxID=1544736 RepID=A0ABW1NA28_9ACTN
MRWRWVGCERGSATIWLICVMALVWLVAGGLVASGMVRVARHRAQSAADLSALAGAVHALAAPAQACHRARTLATANHATLTRCTVRTGVIQVQVAVQLPIPLLGLRTMTAHARAGPA